MNKSLIIALLVVVFTAPGPRDAEGLSSDGDGGPYRFKKEVFGAFKRKLTKLVSKFKINHEKIGHPWEKKKEGCLDPEVHMNVSQIIRYHGYPVEEYTVTTNDGFLLGVQRIPHGRHNEEDRTRPAVFLQHGLLCSSTNWVTNLPNESLAYILADAGYDVWLGNIRGNVYSRKHKTLDPGMPKFWAWSWDEHAALDLPTMINFTLKTSGAKNLFYVGHSQGTLIAFAQLSRYPYLRDKIKMFFAMGPVITAKHVLGLVHLLAYVTPQIRDFFYLFGINEFLPNDFIMKLLADTICETVTQPLCTNVFFLIAGYDTSNFNSSRLPVYISHTPAGTSVQNMYHFSQMVRNGKFQMYDYESPSLNKKHYGQKTPPLYDATKVTVPTVVFSAGKDWLADPQDVKTLVSKLPNLLNHHVIPSWNHLDFIWGIDARRLVYDKILAYMKKAEKR